MTDNKILDLYWGRDETAITESGKQILEPDSVEVKKELERLTGLGYKVGYATQWTYQGDRIKRISRMWLVILQPTSLTISPPMIITDMHFPLPQTGTVPLSILNRDLMPNLDHKRLKLSGICSRKVIYVLNKGIRGHCQDRNRLCLLS